jgi:ABC-type Na+ efflux pump permease subunit
MRAIILLLAVVVLLAFIGWLTVSTGPDRASINLEKQEIKEDTREMLEAGDKAIDRARESVDQSDVDDDAEAESDDVDVRTSESATSDTTTTVTP